MPTPSAPDVTRLLLAWSEGDQAAFDAIIPLVYDELHRLAHERLRRERPGHLLQTTGLVNEAYVRLAGWPQPRWQNRAHLLGIAARLMREILVDFARKRLSTKRGGGLKQVSLDEAATSLPDIDLVALDDALGELSAIDARKSQIVELRFFGGLTVEETAATLGISPRSVMREWALARAWLFRELSAAPVTE
jgi:RNA polymerase sigma-70 factor, ECF subfamily